MGKQVITANDIKKAAESGNKILNVKKEDCIVTPVAWDKAKELGVRFAGDLSDVPACALQSGTEIIETIKHVQSGGDPNTDIATVNYITDQVCSLLQDKLPDANTPNLKAIVKKVVESRVSDISALDSLEQCSALTTHGGVSLIKGDKLMDEYSGPDLPGKVMISDAIRCHQDSPLTANYMKWEKASFSRTVKSPEISIVLEGELDLIIGDKTLRAKSGDMLYMDKGSHVTYRSPSVVKIACVS
ncbi:MAG: hypothetical protein DRH26_04045 [Deltaproteobacteria bacterium]|nr:MAG: hypothetical protein DRH26_04045 [Deltaproteobacteria bacterium]